MFLLAQNTIIVKVIDQEPTTGFDLADVLIRALGVTGVLIVPAHPWDWCSAVGSSVSRASAEAGRSHAIGADLRVTPSFQGFDR
jgi:hypothetical protein